MAELPLTTQARLLRVLESGEFLKVGSSTVQRTNIRVVAATNVDMAKAVAEGRFRQDLYYRLSTVQINVPPLRDRGSDITLLARKFAADFSERYSTPEISLSDDARTLLASYRWPGNVRQLKTWWSSCRSSKQATRSRANVCKDTCQQPHSPRSWPPQLRPTIRQNAPTHANAKCSST